MSDTEHAMITGHSALELFPGNYPQSVPVEEAATGLRYNKGKTRFDLLPPDGLEALAEVYTKGAEKYAARNWEKGLSWTECYGSLLRHANEWAKREDRDSESGQLHMAHVAWNAMALLTFALRGIGTDDRA